jgi:cytidine deaminase
MREYVAEGKDKELMEAAEKARGMAYTPYSHFKVGAAILCSDQEIITGCNIESASYSPTNCAERTAFFKAVSEGKRSFLKIAVTGGPEGEPGTFCPPCGVCRQVMREFSSPDTFVILLKSEEGRVYEYTLSELLPESFGPENLA